MEMEMGMGMGMGRGSPTVHTREPKQQARPTTEMDNIQPQRHKYINWVEIITNHKSLPHSVVDARNETKHEFSMQTHNS